MRYALLVLLTLLALPGCSMLGANGDAGPTETVTPAPVTDAESVDKGVTTATTTPTPGRPGRSDGGAFENLLDDHARRVANVSYAYRHTIQIGGSGSRAPNITVEGYRGRNRTVYYLDRDTEDRRDRVWSNGTVRVSARERPSGTEYDAGEASGERQRYRSDVERLRWLFGFARPTTVDENRTHYHIEGVFVRRDGRSVLGADTTIENSSLSMTVTREGLIESYRVSIRGEDGDGERIAVSERFSLDQSVDTLPRPGWVDRAIEAVREEQFGNRLDGFGYVDEHEAALEGESYAYRFETRTDDPDVAAIVRNETVSGYSGTERSVFRFEQRYPDDGIEDSRWSNGTVTVWRHVDDNVTDYDVERRATQHRRVGVERVREVLEFAELRERRTNATHELIEATLVERDGMSLFRPDVTVESSTLSLVVSDGVVEAYDLEATVVVDAGGRATVTERFRLDRSVDTLPRPGWVDAAIENETAG